MIISLDKSIYPLVAIKKSVRAYKNLAKFNITEKKEFILVKLSAIDKDVKDIIKDEFCNNVISQIK